MSCPYVSRKAIRADYSFGPVINSRFRLELAPYSSSNTTSAYHAVTVPPVPSWLRLTGRPTISPGRAGDRAAEHGPGHDAGVELAVLAKRIGAGGQVVEKRLIEPTTGKAAVELRRRAHRRDNRLESGVQHGLRQFRRGHAPDREDGVKPRARELGLPVRANVLQEEIAKGEGVSPSTPAADRAP